MSSLFVNSYVAPPISDTLPKPTEGPYDLNFVFDPIILENDLVRLVPYIPALHEDLYLAAVLAHPQVFRYFPWGPFPTRKDVRVFFEYIVRRASELLVFVIIDKTRISAETSLDSGDARSFAGTIGMQNSSAIDRCSEVGHLIVFPEFQRTHVNSNAVGLVLSHCLNRPKDGGLGLRRVQWRADERNQPSIKAAQKLGFRFEGVIRWQRVLREGKEANEWDDGSPPSRHCAMLSLCCDDWEQAGVRELVERTMVLRKTTGN